MPADSGTFPFIVAKVRSADFNDDKHVLRVGLKITTNQINGEIENAGLMGSTVGDGRIKHDKASKSIIIYSTPGPSHKVTFGILKKSFPDYTSIIWRDG
jgi:hypothetical protein